MLNGYPPWLRKTYGNLHLYLEDCTLPNDMCLKMGYILQLWPFKQTDSAIKTYCHFLESGFEPFLGRSEGTERGVGSFSFSFSTGNSNIDVKYWHVQSVILPFCQILHHTYHTYHNKIWYVPDLVHLSWLFWEATEHVYNICIKIRHESWSCWKTRA